MTDFNANIEKDQYVIQWLTGLSDRTKNNYLIQFKLWNSYFAMTPTEQIKKRIADLKTKT